MLWQRSGSQGAKWKKASVQIPVSSAPYNLVVEGSMGAPDVRGISLDDIVLADHACPVDDATTCNFENDMCAFKHSVGTPWKRQQADSAGVVRDHTTSTPNGYLAILNLNLPDDPENPGGAMDGTLFAGGDQISIWSLT